MGAVYISLYQTLTNIDHSREYLNRLRMTDLIMNRLQRELMSAFLPLDDESLVFIGRNQGSDEQAEDTLHYLIKQSRVAYLKSAGVYEVKYALRDTYEETGKQFVWSATPLRGMELGKPKEIILGEGIVALNFQYYFDKKWHDSYDATSYGFLPQAVKIDLVINTDKGVQWQQLVVEVPTGGPKI